MKVFTLVIDFERDGVDCKYKEKCSKSGNSNRNCRNGDFDTRCYTFYNKYKNNSCRIGYIPCQRLKKFDKV